MIFNSNWPNLSNEAKKILLIIMARSLTPVEVVSAHIIPLNLESFKRVSIYKNYMHILYYIFIEYLLIFFNIVTILEFLNSISFFFFNLLIVQAILVSF